MLQEFTNTSEETRDVDPYHGLSALVGRDLTSRERQVWLLMATGLSDVEIAERLALNSLTVRVHMSNALIKLGVAPR